MLTSHFSHVIVIALVSCYKAVIKPRLATRLAQIVLNSLENGVHLIDALGRASILPIEIARSKEVRT